MGKKIHVMQVTFGMPIGGMERVIMDLCRYVDPDRYRFSICCTSVRGPLADQMVAEGIPVIYCPNQSRPAKYLRGLELSRIFRRSDVDILHTHNISAFIDTVIGSRFAKIPVLINTDHCKDYTVEKKHLMLLERAASYFADEIIAVSNHTRDEMIQYEGIAPGKVSVIYNGINIQLARKESPEELRKEFGLKPEDTVIGTVGRVVEQKGFDLLLRSAPYILSRFPKTKFIIVGGGEREQDLRRLASELKVTEQFIFTSWRRDAVDLIRIFDVFAMTSRFEGMPMVLLEAMALSKPIVATAVGGVPEVVLNKETGIMIDRREPELLADALSALAGDPALARRMGSNGRARYEKYFTAEAMAAAYEERYRRYLEKRRER
jgi:glycosyltransferase involved in cell wall biosynthesis